MFYIAEDKTIHITRGDIGNVVLSIQKEDGTAYYFQPGDVVRFRVFKRRDCGQVEIQKDVTPTTGSSSVDIFLSGEETKIGEIINKPVDYWYEIELNPETSPQTIIGYDEDGEKVFRLYPEGSETE